MVLSPKPSLEESLDSAPNSPFAAPEIGASNLKDNLLQLSNDSDRHKLQERAVKRGREDEHHEHTWNRKATCYLLPASAGDMHRRYMLGNLG